MKSVNERPSMRRASHSAGREPAKMRWVWGSTKPGRTTPPSASITRSAGPSGPASGPTATINPSRIRTSPRSMTPGSARSRPRFGRPALAIVTTWLVLRISVVVNVAPSSSPEDRARASGDPPYSSAASRFAKSSLKVGPRSLSLQSRYRKRSTLGQSPTITYDVAAADSSSATRVPGA